MNYNIIISEPWDFKNSDGSNIISGQIIRIVNEEIAIFKCDEKVLLNGFEGDFFLLSRRFSHQRFFKGVQSITVNGAGISSSIEDINPSIVNQHQLLFIGLLKRAIRVLNPPEMMELNNC